MAILETTATLKEITKRLPNADKIIRVTKFTDKKCPVTRDDETFYVYSVEPGVWQDEIEDALRESGHKFQWMGFRL